jgi:hypothetical protein
LLEFNGGYLQLVIDPFNSDVLYVIQSGMGWSDTRQVDPLDMYVHVLKSIDGGKTWNLLLADNVVFLEHIYNPIELLLSPLSQNTLYAFLYNKLYRSDDGGSSWKRITLPVSQVINIAISPTDPQGLFAATRNGQLFKSNDAGLTWQTVKHNIAVEILEETYWINTTFKKLWISSKQTNVLYLDVAVAYYEISKYIPPLDTDYMKSALSPDKIIIESYKSNDGGQTWLIIPKPQITGCQRTCYEGLFYIDPYHKDVL